MLLVVKGYGATSGFAVDKCLTSVDLPELGIPATTTTGNPSDVIWV